MLADVLVHTGVVVTVGRAFVRPFADLSGESFKLELGALADVNPAGFPSRRLDAVVFSPHKFVGGPGSTGVLIVKRALLTRVTPAQPGRTTTVAVCRMWIRRC